MDARLQFKLRGLINFVIVLGIFLPLATVFSRSSFPWLWDAALIAVLFYLYFWVLNTRAIRLTCTNPNCRKPVATNTPWICGFCDARNDDTDTYPFLNRCKHCRNEPKAYQCHHEKCGELIFLGSDRQATHFARCVRNIPDEGREQSRSRQAKEHEIKMEELEEKHAAIRRRREGDKEGDPMEAIRKEFEKRFARGVSAEVFAIEQKKKVDEQFKDDEYLRDKLHLLIDDLVRDFVSVK